METGNDKIGELVKSGEAFKNVPKEPWERLYESALGAWPAMKDRVPQAVLQELNPDTLWALAVVLAVWAGATIVGGPLAWAVNAGLSVAGLYAIGKDVVGVSESFWHWATTAYQAKTGAQMATASAHFAEAMAKGGAALVSVVLSTSAFRATRSLVLRSLPPKPKPRPKPKEEPKPPKEEPKHPKEEPKHPKEEPKHPKEEPKHPKEEPKHPKEEPKHPKEEPKPPKEEPPFRGPGATLVAQEVPLLWPVGLGALALALAFLVLKRRRH